MAKKWKNVFGSKKVAVIMIISFAIIIATMLSSIILAVTASRLPIEKMVEHILLCLLAILLLNIPLFMQGRLKLRIPTFINITVAVFIVAHFVLGEIYRFYDYIFLFDKALHLTAGVVISILGFSIVYGFSKSDNGAVRLSPFFVALFSFCFCLALLTLWEVYEYIMDSLFATNMMRWQDGLTEVVVDGVPVLVGDKGLGSGLIDTMTDIVVGMVGAVAVCMVLGILVAKYPESTRFYITKRRIKRAQDEQPLISAAKEDAEGGGEGDKSENADYSGES